MLRISVIDDSEKDIRLAVEGWLTGPWVEELRSQSDAALSQRKALTLDLARLWFVDANGVTLLRELAGKRVAHENCSAFISEQLKETKL